MSTPALPETLPPEILGRLADPTIQTQIDAALAAAEPGHGNAAFSFRYGSKGASVALTLAHRFDEHWSLATSWGIDDLSDLHPVGAVELLGSW